jgi:arylsulfatase A-like enzyme
MTRRAFLAAATASASAWAQAPAKKPNIIFILADDLGYGDLGCYGQQEIKTPNIDRMAAEGTRFTQVYAGCTVCAPSRCALMTGFHTGHARVRGNKRNEELLQAGDFTISEMFKKSGYTTAMFGKWGIGGLGHPGYPTRKGWDEWFGFFSQLHAHTYYPPYLIRNSAEVPLPGNRGNSEGTTYAQYVIFDEAVRFIRESRDRPFLAYLPFTPPHGNFDIPDNDPSWALFRDRPWPEPARRYAAMVHLLDRQVGQILALLRELGLEQNTLVLFSGDNGGADYFVSPEFPRGVHGANKDPRTGTEFRGKKGQLYEGGLRVPVVARWPGRIAPGRVSNHLWYFPDILPTIAELCGAPLPPDIDGLSLVPELLGAAAAGRPQAQHKYLYWEFVGQVAVREGNWKAIQPKAGAPWELYDLARDVSERNDLAARHPDVLARLQGHAGQAHTPVVEGTFTSTELHERDRAAKFGGNPPPAKAKARKKGQ